MVEKHISGTAVPRNGQVKRAQILEAAHRHFSYYGFSKVTMNDIASELGMGKASLYYYFPTKEELFQAVLMARHEDFMKAVESRTVSITSASKKIRTFVAMRLDFFQDVLNLNLIDFQHWQSIRPELKLVFKKFAQHEQHLLRRIMNEGIHAGEFATGPVDRSVVALFQIMRGIRCQFLRAIDGPQVTAGELRTLKRDMLFIADIFLRGISTNGSGKH